MAILRVCCTRSFLLRMLVLSGLLALLQLSTSLYMLAVCDRVVPSGSATTLAALTGLAVVLHVAFAGLDAVRARMVCEAGVRFGEHLDRSLLAALNARGDRSGIPLLDDSERVRRFLIGAGPCAAFDLLWLPAFLATAFVLHPLLGVFASASVVLVACVTAIADTRARDAGRGVLKTRHARYVLAWDLYAGSTGAKRRARWQDAAVRWDAHARTYSETTLAAAERMLRALAVGKGLRLVLQSAGFGLGALLAIEGALTPGALVASSLVLARTFLCLDGALAHWSGFVSARESWGRLLSAIDSVEARGAGCAPPLDAGTADACAAGIRS